MGEMLSLGVGRGTLYFPTSGHKGLVTAVLLMLKQYSKSKMFFLSCVSLLSDGVKLGHTLNI